VVAWTSLGLRKRLVLIALLLAGPVTAHALASAGYRVGSPMSKPIRGDLPRRTQATGEENLG